MSEKYNEFTFVTPVGRFSFHKSVPMAHAKLIRDSVMGQILNPKSNEPRLRNSKDIYDYARDRLGHMLARISFTYSVT
jgi:hypothetical protein